MKKVLLEMEKLRYPSTGLGQFCLHLGKSMAKEDNKGLDLHFYLPENRVGEFGNQFHYHIRKPWHKVFIPGSSGFDVWHCMHQDSAYLPSGNAKLLLTVHDLNFMQKYTGAKLKARFQRLQKKVDRSSGIAVISEYTGEILKENIKIPDIPVKVIYNGNPLQQFSEAKQPVFIPDRKFFLAIGVLSPRKNFHVLPPLLKKFPDHFLVVAGPEHSTYTKTIIEAAEYWGVKDRLIMCGSVNDEQKYWLYKNMEALLFPSLSEGFGLPVIEAMSLGKPVFFSRLTSLPEIGGDQAFYFDDFSPECIQNTVESGLQFYTSQPEIPNALIQHAAKFSWESAAKEYLKFYIEI